MDVLRSITPMLEQIERRTGALPKTLLAEGGHLKFERSRTAEAKGVVVLMPLPLPSKNPTSRNVAYDAPILAFRARMETPEAKELYRARAGLAELSNAHFKDRLGLGQVRVRGLANVTSVALLTGLAFNLLGRASSLLGS